MHLVTLFCLFVIILLFFFHVDVKFSFDTNKLNYGDLKVSDETFESNTYQKQEATKNKLYFVGDVMLARHVEYLMLKNGSNYPFTNLSKIVTENSYLIGNFEGSIPKVHNKTPNFNFNFSVDAIYAPALKNANFTHMSLANNHAFDFGFQAFKNTYVVLENNDIQPFGHPNTLSTSSVTFIEIGNYKISVIGLNTVFGEPNSTEINSTSKFAKENSDLQIYFLHWGSEYSKKHSKEQRKLAEKLSDLGADLIIGAHPHVVQDIEIINNTIVFYSLGNFIFDQYFNEDVKKGLVLELTFVDKDIKVNLLPVESKYYAQPTLLTEIERKNFLNDLSKHSTTDIKPQIEGGQIYLKNILATSTEKVIIE